MCGRTAQTVATVRQVALSLGAPVAEIPDVSDRDMNGDEQSNYNLSPGMDAWVFHKGQNPQDSIQTSRMIWGLVPKPGTSSHPLEENDMGRHFQNLMFNARSDDGHLQPTFARLAAARKTCVVAVDGFFEWKTELKAKQPYFVSSEKQSHTLLAGLWTSVATGRPDNSHLATFTILTTAACPSLTWLHSRMPVRLPTVEAAQEWLSASPQIPSRDESTPWHWHKVTPAMASLKFRTAEAIAPLPTMKTVASMFKAAEKKNQKTDPSQKPPASTPPRKKLPPGISSAIRSSTATPTPRLKQPAVSPKKKQKVIAKPAGNTTIDSFFRPKKKN